MANLLSRLTREPVLTSIQLDQHRLVDEALAESLSLSSLTPVILGGSVYRASRFCLSSLGAFSPILATANEVLAYESSRSILKNESWAWEGKQGMKQALFSSFILFSSLRASSHFLQGQNIFLRHFMQNSAVLLAQDAAVRLEFISHDPASWMRRMIGVEILNWQMHAGMALFAHVFPRFHTAELKLDLGWRVLRPSLLGSPLLRASSEHEKTQGEEGFWGGMSRDVPREFQYSDFHKKPHKINYPPSVRDFQEFRRQLSEARNVLESRFNFEKAAHLKVDENAANSLWFFQALEFAKELQARVSVKPPQSLLDPFYFDQPKIDAETLNHALEKMKRKGLDAESEQVLELVIPYSEVVFGGDGAQQKTARLTVFMQNIQNVLQNRVVLVDDSHPYEVPILLRIPSLSLFEALTQEVYAQNAPSFYPLLGETTRDALLRAREMGKAVIGMDLQPMELVDIAVDVPPWVYTIHDVFHAIMSAQSSPAFKNFVGQQYKRLRLQPWADNPIGKEYAGWLLDMNFKEENFFRQSLAFISQDLIGKAQHSEIQEKDFREAMSFLQAYRKDLAAQNYSEGSENSCRSLEAALQSSLQQVGAWQRTYRWMGLFALRARLFFTRK